MNNQIIESYLNESNKLDGSNYSNWKFKMKTVLEAHNAWMITNGDEPKILEGVSVATTIQDWKKREKKEKMLLNMPVKECIIPHIRECKSANNI